MSIISLLWASNFLLAEIIAFLTILFSNSENFGSSFLDNSYTYINASLAYEILATESSIFLAVTYKFPASLMKLELPAVPNKNANLTTDLMD